MKLIPRAEPIRIQKGNKRYLVLTAYEVQAFKQDGLDTFIETIDGQPCMEIPQPDVMRAEAHTPFRSDC